METIAFRHYNGRLTNFKIDDDRIKYRGSWYNYRNFKVKEFKTACPKMSFILENVRYSHSRLFGLEGTYDKFNVYVPVKVTFYWDGDIWRLDNEESTVDAHKLWLDNQEKALDYYEKVLNQKFR